MNEPVNLSLKEAAKMLNITEKSLMLELDKTTCPYGFSCRLSEKGRKAYFVSKEHLQQWIKNNPQKYHNSPD